MSIKNNIAEVQDRVRLGCEKAKRNCEAVNLLAVSKTRSANQVEQAYQAGLKQFGENYVQEGCEKVQALAHLDIEWHFIGPLQSNKTKLVAQHFSWLHSLDRLKIAQRLEQHCAELNKQLNCCIQVNIDNETSKSGCSPAQALELARACEDFKHVTIRGLMAIPSASNEPGQQQQSFAAMSQLYRQLQQQQSGIDTLSMGMSGDLEIAIANESTMVRIGTALFGART